VTSARRRVVVAGGGWAGLAAAVEATRLGHVVTLLEMAPQLGGRARTVEVDGLALDNGQHIAIGAYVETLALMRTVGVTEPQAFLRRPLELCDATGAGLRMRAGPPAAAFALAVLRHPLWTLREKLALLRAAAAWRRAKFRCDPSWTVARLATTVPPRVRSDVIEPLCVAALNTPASAASAAMFLRVLGDALFGGRGHADLLLPLRPLGALVPEPAERWLRARGGTVRCRARVEAIERTDSGWRVHGAEHHDADAVVIATSASESARVAQPHAPEWAAKARELPYEPIVTVYLRRPGARLAAPMVALREGPDAPAQFAFDRGQLGGADGLFAFVVSGAARWLDAGPDATLAATQRQAADVLGPAPLEPVKVITERRATIRCVPGLVRAPMIVASGLLAAGDHVEGPYPSTLEGAVRSGMAAARAV
jgi:squalene-associated FAD-dependent desaturase